MTVVQIAGWYLLVYGVVVALGGGMGYLKARSKISLISGLASGAFLVVAGIVVRQNPTLGLGLGAGIALLLLGVFAKRLLSTRKLMPAGPMLVLGVGALIVCLLGLFV